MLGEKAFDYLVQACLAIGGLILGWLHHARQKELDEMRAETKRALTAAQKAADDLAAHKLYAAENFATTEEMSEALDKTEARLAKQIAQNHEHMLQRLDDIRDRLPRRN